MAGTEVRFWTTGPTGIRYATCGRLLSDDGSTAVVEVPLAGRNTTGVLRTRNVTVASSDVEAL